ncbi:HTH DNA binding domain protein [Salmonella phage SEP13]|nr:HTH DNA binding domain protein [Salmonella phage STP11]UXR08025.1 HTH DNA binding domain protein [Salmonella phage SEP13]
MLNSDADRVSIDKLIEAIVKLDGVFMVKIGDQTDINRVRYKECEDNV